MCTVVRLWFRVLAGGQNWPGAPRQEAAPSIYATEVAAQVRGVTALKLFPEFSNRSTDK